MTVDDKRADYARSPLAKKLGIREGLRIALVNEPSHYFDLFSDLPPSLRIVRDRGVKKDLIHYFARSGEELRADLPALRGEIEENGAIWISWRKGRRAAEGALGEEDVRHIALANGLVDVKVCSVDDSWSALKLVVRLRDRSGSRGIGRGTG